MTEPLLEARGVRLLFTSGATAVTAVDDVDLEIGSGEIVALVGESGSGKSSLARMFALLHRPSSGEIRFRGRPLQHRGRRNRAYYREVQMIYQDPFNSLNSLKRIDHILGRMLDLHKINSSDAGTVGVRRPSSSDKRRILIELLEKVNLTPAADFLHRYPSDLSGGQRQRVAIARALAVRPRLLLADEPTSMLDASMRLDVLNLLRRLRDTEDLSSLFITHDIASARYASDRMYVMYRGRIVESGPTEKLINDPQHPYTRRLLAAAPDPARYKGSGRSLFHDEQAS